MQIQDYNLVSLQLVGLLITDFSCSTYFYTHNLHMLTFTNVTMSSMSAIITEAILVIQYVASVIVSNFVAEKNTGCVMSISSCKSVSITGSALRRNEVYSAGYLSEISGYSTVSLIDTSISNNHAVHGGRILEISNSGLVTITGCKFVNNSASTNGAFVGFRISSLVVTDTVFANNRVLDPFAFSGSVYIYYIGSASFTNCSFNNNSAGKSGAVYIDSVGSTFTGCSFEHNYGITGSAIFSNSAMTMYHCSFQRNKGQHYYRKHHFLQQQSGREWRRDNR
jgi:hypothetical protein